MTTTLAADVARRLLDPADQTGALFAAALDGHGVTPTGLATADVPAARFLDSLDVTGGYEAVHEVLFTALVEAGRAYLDARTRDALAEGRIPSDHDLVTGLIVGLEENLNPNK